MKKYLITSPEFYTSNFEEFPTRFKDQVDIHMPEYALFRDKQTSPINYKLMACGFVDICKSKDIKSFIHQDIGLAVELKATGVHLTSTQFESIPHAMNLGLKVIISTHTKEEVLKAQTLGADYVTYSPIFATPNKGEPKGIENLKQLLEICDIKVFALGGIVESWHVDMLEKTKAYGFASIRYFYKGDLLC